MAADPRSLNGLLYSLGAYLRDARRGTIQATPTTSSLTDSATLATDSTDRWRGSEVWFEDTGTTVTPFSGNAYRVVASSGSNTVTLDRAFVASAGQGVGVSFVLQNLQGEGWPHGLKLEAILTVLRDQGVPTRATVTIASPNSASYWNAIPAGLDSVYRVEAIASGTGYRTVISRAVWRNLNRVDRAIFLPFDATGVTYALYGRTRYAEPSHATAADFAAALPQVQPYLVVRKAAEWLLSSGGTVQEQRVVNGLYGDRARSQRSLPLPGEVFLADWQ